MESPRTEAVWTRLAVRGMRRTPQREAIIEVLERAGEALPLPVVLARSRRRAPGLGERTAERTVALLVDSGAIDAIRTPDGVVVYRLCGGGHHHHVVCGACGAIAELSGCEVGDWATAEAERQGFLVEGHDVTVHGVCASCRVSAGAIPPGRTPARA
ncbi:MAG: Fur family transcriptional regulator [Thermoleophilia bacterium]